MSDEVFKELSKELTKQYDEAYNIWVLVVDNIINNKLRDIDLIEHTLDNIIGIYTEKGFNLFIKLLFYYSSVDLEKSYDYFDILKEQRSEEYDEYIKKLKK